MAEDGVPKGWHRHPNGGGLVQDTARVDPGAYVGQNSTVEGHAVVGPTACIGGKSRVLDFAYVDGMVLGSTVSADSSIEAGCFVTRSEICGTDVYNRAKVISCMLLTSAVDSSTVVDATTYNTGLFQASKVYDSVLFDVKVKNSELEKVNARDSAFCEERLESRDVLKNEHISVEVPEGFRKHKGGGLVSCQATVDSKAAVLLGCVVHRGAVSKHPEVIIHKDIAPYTIVTEDGETMTDATEALEKTVSRGTMATITEGLAKAGKTAGKAVKVSATGAALTKTTLAICRKAGLPDRYAENPYVKRAVRLALPNLVKLAVTNIPQLSDRADGISNLMDEVFDQALASVTDDVMAEVVKIAGENIGVLAELLGSAGEIEGEVATA